jgi:hypothetical protein
MQQLRFLFQLSATVLVCLSAVIFAAAEGNPLAAATLPLAVLTLLLIDRPDRAGIGAGWALALGLLGAAAALWEFVSGNVEARLLAPAHLVTYSTWVFLLQRKQARQYWLLFGLSVLLVAVSSLLTSADWLGLSLVVYACVGLWTLGVFSVYRATLPLEASLRRAHAVALTADPVGPRRMRRGGVPRGERSFVRHAVQLDPHEHWVGPRFVGGAVATMVLSLGLSVLFFVLIPRVWLGQFRLFDDRPLPGGRTLTGFTEEVALGDMGEILESDDLVMEIQLFDHDTGTPVPAGEYLAELNGGEPLFRGAVLEQYVSGRWLAGRGAGPSRDPRLRSESGALRQQIRLQPIGSWTLFGVGTVLTCIPIDPDDAVFYNRSTNIFQRPANADLSRVAEYRAVSSRTDLGLTRLGNGDWGQFDRRRLARVAAQAWALTADRDGRTLSDREKAKLLEASLRDSGEFHYSLNLAIGDATIDPLVDGSSVASRAASTTRGPDGLKCGNFTPMPGSRPTSTVAGCPSIPRPPRAMRASPKCRNGRPTSGRAGTRPGRRRGTAASRSPATIRSSCSMARCAPRRRMRGRPSATSAEVPHVLPPSSAIWHCRRRAGSVGGAASRRSFCSSCWQALHVSSVGVGRCSAVWAWSWGMRGAPHARSRSTSVSAG